MSLHTARILRLLGFVLPALSLVLANDNARAQKPAAQYMFQQQNPPGAVGQMRLQRGGPVVGYYQPVELMAPKGIVISMADQAGWTEPTDEPIFCGMQLGVPYRLKLSNLPDHFRNTECYPTIEIIDRTYAPVGLEKRFPIPILFTENELQLATEGMLVTRVVYIEDPKQALPGREYPGDQLWHDAGPRANPLEVADRLGRPVAIVRLGGRTPNEAAGPDMEFLYGCPKWLRLMRPPVEMQQVPTTAPQPLQQTSARRATAG